MPGSLIKLRFTLNERPVALQCHPGARLLDILRSDFGLKGTREGCGHGECGACLVLMNGTAVNSCLVPAFVLADSEILTIEGIQSLKSFADIRRKLPGGGSFRCGFCSSGMMVALTALLLSSPAPSAEEIHGALSGNLCACGSYGGVVSELARRKKKRNGKKRGERG